FDAVDCLAAHAHAARQAGRAYAPSLASLGQPVPDARLHHDFLTIVSLRLEECRYEYRHGRRDTRSTLGGDQEMAGAGPHASQWERLPTERRWWGGARHARGPWGAGPISRRRLPARRHPPRRPAARRPYPTKPTAA